MAETATAAATACAAAAATACLLSAVPMAKPLLPGDKKTSAFYVEMRFLRLASSEAPPILFTFTVRGVVRYVNFTCGRYRWLSGSKKGRVA